MNWSQEAHKLHRNVIEHELWQKGAALLLAFSGGRDSVFLTELLLELRPFWEFDLNLMRLHHGLRPEEDESEDDFALEYAATRRIPLKIEKIDVPKACSNNKKGLEANARELRYDALRNYLYQLGGNGILTAHHADDQAETVLYRLLTGSATRGLQGMAWKSEKILRPLLNFSRTEINAYLNKRQLYYVDDSSNFRSDQQRNKIRNELMPALEKMGFASPSQNLLRSADNIRQMYVESDYFIQDFIARISRQIDRGLLMNKNELLKLQPAQLQLLIYRLTSTYPDIFISHMNSSLRQSLIHFMKNDRIGSSFRVNNHIHCFIDRDTVIFAAQAPKWDPIPINGPGNFEIDGIGSIRCRLTESGHWPQSKSHHTAFFPQEVFKRALILRMWTQGDRMSLFGSGQHKKVSDILTTARIPVRQRLIYPLLCCDNEIIWIPGVKRSAEYQLSAGKKPFIYVNFELIQRKDQDEIF